MSEQIVVTDELCDHVERYWGERGRQWTLALPQAIAEITDEWSLRLGNVYPGASTAYVTKVERSDGSSAVLKVAFPEVIGEADALYAYRGNGAILLYAYDVKHCALLLERCRPGTTLRAHNNAGEILSITCTLMQRLWTTTPAPSIPMLRDHCARLAESGEAILAAIEGACSPPSNDSTDSTEFDTEARVFAHKGLDLLRGLSDESTRELMLHGDLHSGNVQRATREPWLAIDPKPLLGDPAYEPIPLIIEAPTADQRPLDQEGLVERVGIVARRLDLSPLRIASWGVARRIDWALFCLGRHEYAAAARPFTEARWFHRAMCTYAGD